MGEPLLGGEIHKTNLLWRCTPWFFFFVFCFKFLEHANLEMDFFLKGRRGGREISISKNPRKFSWPEKKKDLTGKELHWFMIWYNPFVCCFTKKKNAQQVQPLFFKRLKKKKVSAPKKKHTHIYTHTHTRNLRMLNVVHEAKHARTTNTILNTPLPRAPLSLPHKNPGKIQRHAHTHTHTRRRIKKKDKKKKKKTLFYI